MILVHAACDLPLRETVALVAEAGGPDIAPMRLHKKMIRADDDYLREVGHPHGAGSARDVARVVGGLRRGRRRRDDSVAPGLARCGRSRAHTDASPRTWSTSTVQVTNTKVGETFAHFPLEFGQLVIGDRGYSFCVFDLPGAAARGADVLVRLNRGSTPLLDRASNERIDVLGAMRDLVGHAVVERDVVIEWTGPERREHRLDARLILQRLPESEAAKARKRLRDELGADATADSLEAAGYVALLTTVKKTRLVGRALHGPVSPTLADPSFSSSASSLCAASIAYRTTGRTQSNPGSTRSCSSHCSSTACLPSPSEVFPKHIDIHAA